MVYSEFVKSIKEQAAMDRNIHANVAPARPRCRGRAALSASAKLPQPGRARLSGSRRFVVGRVLGSEGNSGQCRCRAEQGDQLDYRQPQSDGKSQAQRGTAGTFGRSRGRIRQERSRKLECGLDLKFLRRGCRKNGRNFKSTTPGRSRISVVSRLEF